MFTRSAADSSPGAVVNQSAVEPRDEAVSTRVQRAALPLYVGRIKVHPKRVSGPYRGVKWLLLAVCLGVYYLLPWLRWDRGERLPDQAVMIDLDGRRAYFFFIEIWPQEVYYITGLLILAAFGLFLATALFGRLWCGYACPQTVWTDLFMAVERLIEGDRAARIRLDKESPGAAKLAKRAAKHAAWLAIAAMTGGAWVMYFGDAPTMLAALFKGEASVEAYVFVGLFTATTYLLAGWAREQLCTYMCPWPRFQAAMQDEHSLTVSYRAWRGEPRGAHKAGTSWEGRGDCVDCKQCIAACPTGIDIRDGQQLECIGCGLCIDACDEIMAKVGRPRGLVAFDTLAALAARAQGRKYRLPLVRARTALYAGLVLATMAAMGVALALRSEAELNVLRDRTPLFVTLSDGGVRNGYTLKVINKTQADRTYRLELSGLPGARMSVVGGEDAPADRPVSVGARLDSVESVRVFVTLPGERLAGESASVRFALRDVRGRQVAAHDSVFLGPRPRP
ncbi:MAG: cytochrome c oxidase accessory protein CcoG [Alphaproteobacteria bacterium]|nr:cytochrome c oxidase accessory protein CcoG [Alphaproteobacteria bacterium]